MDPLDANTADGITCPGNQALFVAHRLNVIALASVAAAATKAQEKTATVRTAQRVRRRFCASMVRPRLEEESL